MDSREYTISVEPKILKFLGPSLYTNVYFVLAELIANAWDADASEVFIIDKGDVLIVEDNGNGMSYEDGDISNYLKVAEETRKDDTQSLTPKGRLKMGRKGVGKLSALAASSKVRVLTIKNGEKSGFILTRDIDDSGKLAPIPDNEICLEKVKGNGTSIQMLQPEYKLNKSIDVISKNIIKLFPVVGPEFKITIVNRDNKTRTISDIDKTIIPELAALITIGKDFHTLNSYFKKEENIKNDYTRTEDTITKPLRLKDKSGNEREYLLEINGWIGAYKSVRNRRIEQTEFPDNYLSIYSRGKIGEFNILPRIGSNRLQEVYVVGQLHINLFEESSLPDMALSNRQGYRDDDLRYIEATKIAEDLLKEITNLRVAWAAENGIVKEKEKIKRYKIKEDKFKQDVNTFKDEVAKKVSDIVSGKGFNLEETANTIKEIINENKSLLGLKPEIDSNKKRILISHTRADKDLADVVYEMLIFNNVPKEDIIYTNSDDEASRIPDEYPVYEYLRDFFVESYSNEKMFVIYITSKEMSRSWGAVVEVGASWITRMNHKIFNINIEGGENNTPLKPLNNDVVWQQTTRNKENNLFTPTNYADDFCVKIENICSDLGIVHRTRDENMSKLRGLLIVED